ncbi:phosphoribulokinase [Macrococcoides canis]|uniref:uridine kinase family protein n=1 Tax=Macrococcoides canis TaxID=1855823 RepID=UPI001AEBC61C|nr:phosphoribulokinase [Macrococcus canis]QTQ08444.1 phosphoribulokinase [Macrococcus canis]
MQELLKEVSDFVSSHTEKIMIGISGHGAAGKSTLVNQLIEMYDKDEIDYLNTDAYIIDSKYRSIVQVKYDYNNKSYVETPTACVPVSHELNSLMRDISLLKYGHNLHTIEEPWMPSKIINGNKRILIVEGMSLTFVDQELFDLSIFIYADSSVELTRRLDRDVKFRNGNPDYIIASHEKRRRQYEVFMKPLAEKFDILYKNN